MGEHGGGVIEGLRDLAVLMYCGLKDLDVGGVWLAGTLSKDQVAVL